MFLSFPSLLQLSSSLLSGDGQEGAACQAFGVNYLRGHAVVVHTAPVPGLLATSASVLCCVGAKPSPTPLYLKQHRAAMQHRFPWAPLSSKQL